MLSYDVVAGAKPLQKAEKPTPKQAGTEVLLKLKYCGVCTATCTSAEGYFEPRRRKAFQNRAIAGCIRR